MQQQSSVPIVVMPLNDIMEKKEYLELRFKKDFLQYSLLQEDSWSAEDIADKLMASVNLTGYYQQMANKISDLCEQYLSFDKLRVADGLTNQLPDEFRLEIKDRIIADYECFLTKQPIEDQVGECMEILHRQIERLAWRHGIGAMTEALERVISCFKEKQEDLSTFAVSRVDLNTLRERYEDARKISILERIQGNNIDDITAYYDLLQEYVRDYCERLLQKRLSDIYGDLAGSEMLERLRQHFAVLAEQAVRMRTALPELPDCPDWDKEYNRLVPTDFYERNVEEITAEQAFHIVLLQFFAKNEDWMVENGLLVNGEICMFVQIGYDIIGKLLPVVWQKMCI